MPLRIGQKVQALLRGNLTPGQRRLPSALTQNLSTRDKLFLRPGRPTTVANKNLPLYGERGMLARNTWRTCYPAHRLPFANKACATMFL